MHSLLCLKDYTRTPGTVQLLICTTTKKLAHYLLNMLRGQANRFPMWHYELSESSKHKKLVSFPGLLFFEFDIFAYLNTRKVRSQGKSIQGTIRFITHSGEQVCTALPDLSSDQGSVFCPVHI